MAVDFRNYPKNVRSVLTILEDHDVDFQISAFDQPAHRADQAAELLNCPLGAIVKSLVFETVEDQMIFIVLVSGTNRADYDILEEIFGKPVRAAQPDVVLEKTGYPVGAVPPIGLQHVYTVIMDADLLRYERVWASAGSAHVLMGLSSKALQQLSQARAKRINKEKG